MASLSSLEKDVSYLLAMDGLSDAIKKNNYIDVVGFLEAKADINGTFLKPKGVTPLQLAASIGSLNMVKVLVENKADINLKGISGQTALHVATIKKTTLIVNYLIQQGADNTIKDDKGYTAIQYK